MEKKKQFIETIEEDIEAIKRAGIMSGGFAPHINLYVKRLKDSEDVIMRIPIADEFLDDKEKKQFFKEIILPDLSEKLKSDYDIYASMFVSEVTIIQINTNEEISLEDVNFDGKKDYLFISVETKNPTHQNTIILYNVKNNGMKVSLDDETGESHLINDITLNYEDFDNTPGEIKGTFSNLLKIFTEC